jgi:hypothetical protein
MPHKEPHHIPIGPSHQGQKEIEVTLKCHLMKEPSQGNEEINDPDNILHFDIV